MSNLLPVGEVRPSQLLWTYGPGALIDLPNLSVLTMGLDRWEERRCQPIEEDRLLQAVRRVLGHQVTRLRMPPINPGEAPEPLSAEAKIGVPVRPFPRWLRCVKCGTLAEFDSGLFEIKDNPYRPEDTHFIHKHCEKGKYADAVPARFLLACRNGHLDDFPWRYYVHGGNTMCKGMLSFFEQGASMQTENLWVKCTCGASKSLVHAFGSGAKDYLPQCRGRHPHLNYYEDDCKELPRAVLLGATNSWFSVSISVLAIPRHGNALDQIIADAWTDFEEAEDENEVRTIIKTLSKRGELPGIDTFTVGEVWTVIERRRSGQPEAVDTEYDIKRPEWEVLTNPSAPNNWPHFMTSKAGVPSDYKDLLEDVLLLERLREVNALIGFTRVEAPEESDDPDERPPMARLTRESPTWVPAFDVHGEGIFIRFSENAIQQWIKGTTVKQRDAMLLKGHRAWRVARNLSPDINYPGIRYAMIHTFSHLLIRELALECGYNTASIRERIYSDNDSSKPMAGILIYTAAADSDGTLGGLVELGKPENLGRLIKQALSRAEICPSDPLCSEHDAAQDRSLHGASCHGCSFVAETSCERGNRYLDRSLVIPTFETASAAFFAKHADNHE